jgi:hypothetical protein
VEGCGLHRATIVERTSVPAAVRGDLVGMGGLGGVGVGLLGPPDPCKDLFRLAAYAVGNRAHLPGEAALAMLDDAGAWRLALPDATVSGS